MLEERELNAGAKILTGLGVERHIAKAASIAARPSAVDPRTFDKRGGCFRVELRGCVEGSIGAAEVFGVVPAADDEHCAFHVLHMARKVASLPIGVVGVVLGLVVEKPIRTLQIKLVE